MNDPAAINAAIKERFQAAVHVELTTEGNVAYGACFRNGTTVVGVLTDRPRTDEEVIDWLRDKFRLRTV